MRVVGLVQDSSSFGRPLRRVVTVDANGNTAVGTRTGAVALELFEVISRTVSLRAGWQAPCERYDAAAVQTALRTLETQLRAVPLEQQREGQEALQLAASVAQLRHEAFRDSLNLIRYDAVSMEMRAYIEEHGSRQAVTTMRADQRQEQWQQSLAVLGNTITTYAEQTATKYKLLARDAERYRTLSATMERSLSAFTRQFPAIREETSRFAEYQRTVLDEIARTAAAPGEPTSLVTFGLRRACADAASVRDIFELRMQTASPLAVLEGELTFDDGTVHPVVVRREKETDRWIGRMAWPSAAAQATLRLRPPGQVRWHRVDGALQPGRRPFTQVHATLSAQYAEARRMYEETSRRAKGSDHVRTLVIP